jgi:predicted PurR-regulated permease PerM
LTYAGLVSALVIFVLLVMPMVLEQGTSVTRQVSSFYNEARTFLVNSPSQILHNLGYKLSPKFQVEDLAQQPPAQATPSPSTQTQTESPDVAKTVDTVNRAFQYTGLLIRVLFAIIAVFLMAFFWNLEGERAIRSLLLLVPFNKRENLRSVVEGVENKLGGFLLGQSLLCATIGAFSLIAYLLIGLPNALVLGLIAGVLEAVPTVGPLLGAIPAILVASSISTTKIIWVIAATVLIQFSENHLLVPRIMDRSVGVNPLLTLLSLAALSSLLGLLGALLAVPLAAIFQYLINRFVLQPMNERPEEPEGRDYLSVLRMQAQEIAIDSRKHASRNEEMAEAEEEGIDRLEDIIEGMANELEKILAQTSSGEAGQR